MNDGKPTIFDCSVCQYMHWSNYPGCVQVLKLKIPDVTTPTDTRMSWEKRHFCGVCPLHNQPKDGFNIIEFAEHQFSHMVEAIRIAALDAHNFKSALTSIDQKLNSSLAQEFPPKMLLQVIKHEVTNALKP